MLRDYQQDLYRKTVEEFKRGKRRVLVVAPCGAGKSYLFAEMVRRTAGECLVLVHRNELKQQHQELFQNLGIENARIETYQTESRRLGEYKTPRLLIVDEAHLSRSNSWQKIIEYYNTWTVGMSATPCRLDGKPLGQIYSSLVQGVDTRWLIEHQRLAPYEYYAPTLVETEGLRTLAGDYVASDLEALMTGRAIYGDVIKSYHLGNSRAKLIGSELEAVLFLCINNNRHATCHADDGLVAHEGRHGNDNLVTGVNKAAHGNVDRLTTADGDKNLGGIVVKVEAALHISCHLEAKLGQTRI